MKNFSREGECLRGAAGEGDQRTQLSPLHFYCQLITLCLLWWRNIPFTTNWVLNNVVRPKGLQISTLYVLLAINDRTDSPKKVFIFCCPCVYVTFSIYTSLFLVLTPTRPHQSLRFQYRQLLNIKQLFKSRKNKPNKSQKNSNNQKTTPPNIYLYYLSTL